MLISRKTLLAGAVALLTALPLVACSGPGDPPGRGDDPDRGTRPNEGNTPPISLPSELTAPCPAPFEREDLVNRIDPQDLGPSDRELLEIESRWVELESRDGLTVPAYLVEPAGRGPFPAVVWVHGGTHETVTTGVIEAIAANGFVALGVDYRGSSGHGRRYQELIEIGEGDVDDVIAGGRYLADHPRVDGERIAVAGGSRGAATALLAAARAPDLFGAAGSFYGIVDWACALAHIGPRVPDNFQELFGGSPDEVPEEYMRRSPYYHADRIRMPVYMAHGLRDRRPPPGETLKMAEELRARGTDVTVRFYSALSHGFMEDEPPESPLWEDFVEFLEEKL